MNFRQFDLRNLFADSCGICLAILVGSTYHNHCDNKIREHFFNVGKS